MNRRQFMFERLQRILHAFGGRSWYYLGKVDLHGDHVKVCIRCGCHFVGDSCPSNRRHLVS